MNNIEQYQGDIPVTKKPEDDEINLIDLFAVLWHRKVMILVITIIAAVGVVGKVSWCLQSFLVPLPPGGRFCIAELKSHAWRS
ncbi:hypothetical protein Holit_01984 [Hollandina sp. SP2]